MSKRVSREEWMWVGIVSAIVVLAFSAPYLIGWLRPVEGRVFAGLTTGIADMNSYLAKMRLGAQGLWLYEIPYTHEEHDGAFFFFHYIAYGHLIGWISGEGARVSGQTLVIAFHAARVIAAFTYLAVLYRFASEFIEDVAIRRLAWTLASVMGGLGWIRYFALLAQGGAEFIDLPIELYTPESHSLLILYTIPHLLLARALLLGGWLLMFRAQEDAHPGWVAGAALAWAGMSTIQVIYGAVAGAVAFVWWLSAWAGERRFSLRLLIQLAAALIFPVSYGLYAVWTFTYHPIFSGWAAQTEFDPLPVIQYVLAFGLLIALGLPAWVGILRAEFERRKALLLIWPPLALMMLALPFIQQRRFIEGAIVPISVLAALGMARIVGEGGETPDLGWRLRWLAMAAALMMLLPSTGFLLLGGIGAALDQERPISYSVEEIAALDYLRLHAEPEDLVISSGESGNLIPAYASVRSYIGLATETFSYEVKDQMMAALYSGQLSAADAALFFEATGADYLWYGPLEAALAEKAGGLFDAEALGLSPVFEAGEFKIYEVHP